MPAAPAEAKQPRRIGQVVSEDCYNLALFVSLDDEQVERANQLAEAERERLREGASDLVVLNLRELAAAEAANQVIDAHADFERARADFLVATGRPPSESPR